VTPIGKDCNERRGVRVTKEQLTDEGRYPVYQNTNYPMGYFDNYNVDANTPFVIVGGSAGQIGLSKERYWAADDCAYFEKSNTLNKVFLYYELTHRQFEIKKFVRTASVPRLDRKIIESFVLPLPSLPEQHRIASALTSIDNLISSLGKLIEKKKNIKQGAMQQLLTGKTRLKGFNEPWMEHTIDELFDLGNGYTPSKSNPAYWTNGTIPWFRMEDLRTNGRILKDSIQHVTPEAVKGNGLYPKYSIILSTTATIGEHALLIAESLANQRFTFLNRKVNRRDMIDIIFFYYYCFILGKWCRANINAGGLLAVNMDDLKNHSIYIPKSIAEQQDIATILTKMDDEITALEAKKAKYEAIKQGMMQQLLTGKIRLIG
uniref:restriction endonuclease subunit S n=1 Tax=Prevotella sp. TaxID=59823 RepID=UPI004024AFA9